jgi:hypothetical protein
MRPSTKPTCGLRALWKLGLLVLVVLLPLSLISCASSKQLAQKLEENHGNFLTPLLAPAPKPAVKPDPKPFVRPDPLQVCATVPEEDLQDMRGCQGVSVYFFDYNFDINLLATPQVSVSSNFQAVLPDGSPAPSVNSTSAVYRDNSVSYIAGPTGNGLSSQLLVTGHDNIVFANTQFNIHLPNASVLTPTISVLPANSLMGIVR